MIPRIAHPMTPPDLPIHEPKLATDLLEVAALERAPAAHHALIHALDHARQQRRLDVVRPGRAELQRARHAEPLVQRTRRVCVDGEAAGCGGRVHGDERGVAAADDDEGRRWGGVRGLVLEGFGRDGGEGADVFLAVLWVVSLALGFLRAGRWLGWRETYAAEEMPDEYYEGFSGAFGAGIEGLEGVGIAFDVEDGEVCDALEVCC